MSNLFNEVTDMKKTDIILLTGLIGSIIFSNFAGFEKKLDKINYIKYNFLISYRNVTAIKTCN